MIECHGVFGKHSCSWKVLRSNFNTRKIHATARTNGYGSLFRAIIAYGSGKHPNCNTKNVLFC